VLLKTFTALLKQQRIQGKQMDHLPPMGSQSGHDLVCHTGDPFLVLFDVLSYNHAVLIAAFQHAKQNFPQYPVILDMLRGAREQQETLRMRVESIFEKTTSVCRFMRKMTLPDESDRLEICAYGAEVMRWDPTYANSTGPTSAPGLHCDLTLRPIQIENAICVRLWCGKQPRDCIIVSREFSDLLTYYYAYHHACRLITAHSFSLDICDDSHELSTWVNLQVERVVNVRLNLVKAVNKCTWDLQMFF
jgi:hypothetical protein